MHYNILKFPSTQKFVFLLVPTVQCWSFTIQNDVCAEFDTKGCFHIHLLKVESFNVLTENPFQGVAYKICDITKSLEANPGPIFNLQKPDERENCNCSCCSPACFSLSVTSLTNEHGDAAVLCLCDTLKVERKYPGISPEIQGTKGIPA